MPALATAPVPLLVLTAILVCNPAHAQTAEVEAVPAVAVVPDSSAREATLAEAAKWFKSNLPKLSRAHAVIEVDAHIGGTDVQSVRTWVSSAKLDRCKLTLDRVFDNDGIVAATGGSRVRHEVPLRSVDPASIGVQQTQVAGSRLHFKGKQPWRVVLSLANGSIQTHSDFAGDRYSSNDGQLDLIVANQEAGVEVANRMQAAVMACR
ncbi:MAG TPA: hypothetical protein VFM14_02080 [Gemmatimonadales bacterium]|nr:hypothetical protein [Gemmatimonadales bacterium]